MKFNQWTLGLAAVGVVSLGSAVQAEEAASQVLTAVSGTTLSGYVNTSAIWKFGTGNTPMPGRSFDGAAKQDSFNLDVVKVTLEKPLEEAEWAAGYKVDLLYGPDATAFANGGLGFGAKDYTLQNAYVALRAPVGNGLDFKIGAFDSIIGYEVFDAGSNPNYSRSYAYGLEPFQHAGVLASYRINDMVSMSAGVANAAIGSTSGRVESVKTYMASVTLTAPESMGSMAGSTLYMGIVNGMENPAPATGGTIQTEDTTWYYAGVTMKTPWEQLSLGAAFDYRERGAGASVSPIDSWAWAASGYAAYQVTEKLKFNNRIEYTLGSDGTYFNSGAANGGVAGEQNEFIAYTGTLDYQLWENVITRAEFRYDLCLSDNAPFGMMDESAMSIAANIIYKF